MKKLLLATATAGLLFFGGQAEVNAAPADDLNITATVETQEQGKWSHFRDKYILDRDDRQHHRHYRDYPPPPPPPPPRRSRHYRDYPPPPPPPPPRHHRDRYGPPPPPPPPPRW